MQSLASRSTSKKGLVKTTFMSAHEIMEALRGYLILHGHQMITVVIGRYGGGVVTGELQTIKDEYLEIDSDGDVQVVWRSTIETFSHSPLPTARLPEMAVA